MIEPGSIIVDAGISVVEDGKIVGDVSTAAKKLKAGMYTPVPNGVGPMTVAKVMENVTKSYEKRMALREHVEGKESNINI